MWEYIVNWVIVLTVATSCPDANKQDEFGQNSTSNTSCAVYHSKTIKTPKEKRFFNKDSAFQFYNRALKNKSKPNWIIEDGLDEIKIDSVFIKK